MNTHKLFSEFDSKIKLNESSVEKLKQNRKALRDKIKSHFEDKGWPKPNFYSQGSFPLKTNVNPITGSDYDLDDGVYFICSNYDKKEVSTYHSRLKSAVDGHAKEVKDKNTCVRVIYADGHHIDLPCYWIDKDQNEPTPQLAHKSEGFVESDPKAFKVWVDGKISDSDSGGQLRRIVRYLKAWKDFREDSNSSLKLPSGFILTILACKNYIKDDKDDIAFQRTIKSIKSRLDYSFTCYRPTVPANEDLLSKYSETTVLNELSKLVDGADVAVDSACEKEASEHWRKVFGSRFPLGKNDYGRAPFVTKVEKPWLSN